MFKKLVIVELLQDLPEHGVKAGETGCVMKVLDDGKAYEVAFPHPRVVVEARLLRKWSDPDEHVPPLAESSKSAG